MYSIYGTTQIALCVCLCLQYVPEGVREQIIDGRAFGRLAIWWMYCTRGPLDDALRALRSSDSVLKRTQTTTHNSVVHSNCTSSILHCTVHYSYNSLQSTVHCTVLCASASTQRTAEGWEARVRFRCAEQSSAPEEQRSARNNNNNFGALKLKLKLRRATTRHVERLPKHFEWKRQRVRATWTWGRTLRIESSRVDVRHRRMWLHFI